MGNVLVFVLAIIVLLGLTDTTVGQAISTFILAGIVPGTDLRLPWFVMPFAAPPMLFGLYKSLAGLHVESLRRQAVRNVLNDMSQKAAKPVPATRQLTHRRLLQSAKKIAFAARRSFKRSKSQLKRRVSHSKA